MSNPEFPQPEVPGVEGNLGRTALHIDVEQLGGEEHVPVSVDGVEADSNDVANLQRVATALRGADERPGDQT